MTALIDYIHLVFVTRLMLAIAGISCCHVSACLSVTSLYFSETGKRRIMQTMPHDSPGTLVFWRRKYRQNSAGITPTEVRNAGGVG